jgi:hypothetical protein
MRSINQNTVVNKLLKLIDFYKIIIYESRTHC